MRKSSSSTWARVLAVGAVCLMMGASAALAAPGAGRYDSSPQWTIETFFGEAVNGWLASLQQLVWPESPFEGHPERLVLRSTTHPPKGDDTGPVDDIEEESTFPPEYKDPPNP